MICPEVVTQDVTVWSYSDGMTQIALVSGFLPPSSGTAIVNGYDIRTDINKVRSNLGLCPQHNILFDTLTVDEHLHFFARVSCVPYWLCVISAMCSLLVVWLVPCVTTATHSLLVVCDHCHAFLTGYCSHLHVTSFFRDGGRVSWGGGGLVGGGAKCFYVHSPGS